MTFTGGGGGVFEFHGLDAFYLSWGQPPGVFVFVGKGDSVRSFCEL